MAVELEVVVVLVTVTECDIFLMEFPETDEKRIYNFFDGRRSGVRMSTISVSKSLKLEHSGKVKDKLPLCWPV